MIYRYDHHNDGHNQHHKHGNHHNPHQKHKNQHNPHHKHYPNYHLFPYNDRYPSCYACSYPEPYGLSQEPYIIPIMSLDNFEDDDYEKDIEELKGMYPDTTKQVLKLVEEECDKLEYDGSCMFDDCPDKVTIIKITDIIYEKVKYLDVTIEKNNVVEINNESPVLQAANVSQNWLKSMIQILLLNEMHHRRRRHNHHRRRRYY